MPKHGKKYLEAAKLVEPTRLYEPAEAVQLLKDTSTVNFDPTVTSGGALAGAIQDLGAGTVSFHNLDSVGVLATASQINSIASLSLSPRYASAADEPRFVERHRDLAVAVVRDVGHFVGINSRSVRAPDVDRLSERAVAVPLVHVEVTPERGMS